MTTQGKYDVLLFQKMGSKRTLKYKFCLDIPTPRKTESQEYVKNTIQDFFQVILVRGCSKKDILWNLINANHT